MARRTHGDVARSAKCRRERTPGHYCRGSPRRRVCHESALEHQRERDPGPDRPNGVDEDDEDRVQLQRRAGQELQDIVGARPTRRTSGWTDSGAQNETCQQLGSSKDKQFLDAAANRGGGCRPYAFRIDYQIPSLSCGLRSDCCCHECRVARRRRRIRLDRALRSRSHYP